MHNKKLCSVIDIPKIADNLFVADEDHPSLELKDKRLTRCLLVRLGLKDAKIRDSAFLYCIFEGCYFRNVRFGNVDFTGSIFRDCNFHKASFESSMFRYAQFSRCIIDNYDEILQLIPPEPNIAIPVLRSLRQNAVEMGDKDSADRILVLEIEAEKQELKNRFCAPSEYYKSRYGSWEKGKSGLSFLALYLRGLLWGHGLKVLNLLCSAVVCIVVFAYVIQKYSLFFLLALKSQRIWIFGRQCILVRVRL